MKTKKTTADIIEEIHRTFYSAAEYLLAEARQLVAAPSIDQNDVDTANKLAALGFSSTPHVTEVSKQLADKSKVEKDNSSKNLMADAIMYFQMHYPNQKVITEPVVIDICKKYNLVHGSSKYFIGRIPEKNVQDLLNFKVRDCDRLYIIDFRYSPWAVESRLLSRLRDTDQHDWRGGSRFASNDEYQKSMDGKLAVSHYPAGARYFNDTGHVPYGHVSVIYPVSTMEICAPVTDFKLSLREYVNEDRQIITIPDPIALYPVQYGGQKFYLIVTAWGLEASDDRVVNEKMN